jgi:hypothetical protein
VLIVSEPNPDLAAHPDRLSWNARYAGGFTARSCRTRWRTGACAAPARPVLDLASGPSGSSSLAAAAGRRSIAVDASDVALGLLGSEATVVHADLGRWRAEPNSYALVLCAGFWDHAGEPGKAPAS